MTNRVVLHRFRVFHLHRPHAGGVYICHVTETHSNRNRVQSYCRHLARRWEREGIRFEKKILEGQRHPVLSKEHEYTQQQGEKAFYASKIGRGGGKQLGYTGVFTEKALWVITAFLM